MPTQHLRETIYLPELVRKIAGDFILDGHDFRDCTLRGPAVLIVLESVNMTRCRYPSPDVVWPLEVGRGYIGGIGIRNCHFEECTFDGVGIAGDQEFVDTFLGEIEGH